MSAEPKEVLDLTSTRTKIAVMSNYVENDVGGKGVPVDSEILFRFNICAVSFSVRSGKE